MTKNLIYDSVAFENMKFVHPITNPNCRPGAKGTLGLGELIEAQILLFAGLQPSVQLQVVRM